MSNKMRDAIQNAFGYAPESITPDGSIHRFATRDQPQDKAGFCALFEHGDGFQAGFFGNWRTGHYQTWHNQNSNKLSPDQSEKIRQAKIEAEAERDRQAQEAAEKAKSIWENARPAPADHPYLVAKKIQPHLARIDKHDNLVIPVLDGQGNIHSRQLIDHAGQKTFLLGGRIKGYCCPLRGSDQDAPIYIAEGFATAATIFEALQGKNTVLAAFNAGNLKPVAEVVREKYPERQIIILADNDHRTEGNPGMTKGHEAAQAVDGSIVWPEFYSDDPGTDFNDMKQAQGSEAVKARLDQAENTDQKKGEHWPDIIPYSQQDVPEIKADMLPGYAGVFARECARSIQVPESLAVATVLGSISLAATPAIKEVVIRSGYSEPPNLNIVSPLEPGERKSAQLDAANKPILSWETEQAESMRDEVRQAISKRKSLEKVIEQKRSKLAKIEDREALKETIEEIASDEASLPEIKYPPRLLTDDCTPERMAVIMSEHDEVIGVSSAEGGIFDLFDKRYSKVPNLDLFLKAHCGEKYIVDRMGREAVILNRPRLVMTLCPQPEVLQSLSTREGFRGRGVLARILYILSISVLGYRKIETTPIPTHIKQKYESGLRRLLDLRSADITLEMSQSAYAHWTEFAKTVEGELRPGGNFESMTDWAGKLPGAAARIAGLFHAITADLPGDRIISSETMDRALALSAILADHAKEALGQMGVDQTRAAALKILKWIQNTNANTFTARDCFRALQGSFKSADEMTPALDALTERGYIRNISSPPTGPGRPSKIYEVNPEVVQ